MTVFIDGARNGFGRMVMCHMLADTPAELHAMAEAIGMRREWYQSPETASFPHYDLSLTRRKLALERGAKELTRQELNAHMKRVRAELIAHGHTWKSAGWY
jgi:hypothetical protein